MNEYYLTIPDLNMGKKDYSAKKRKFIEEFNTICQKENKDISTVIKNTSRYIEYSKLVHGLCETSDKNYLKVEEIIALCKKNKFSLNAMYLLLNTMNYGIPYEIKIQLEKEWKDEYTDEEYYMLLDYFKNYNKPNPERLG